MRSLLRVWYIAMVLAILLVAGGCARHARPTPPPVLPPTPAPAVAKPHRQFTFTGYQVTFPEEGPRVWVAQVQSGAADEKTETLTLKGISCQLYQNGKETLWVTADTGTAMLTRGKTADIRLTGHVHAKEPLRNTQFDAETFRWTSNDNKITATRVHWLGLGFDHRAGRGIFTTDLTHAIFMGGVETKTTTP